ncbi:MAG: hypothetical protein AAFO07_15660 [Bacteroidota bacterium]
MKNVFFLAITTILMMTSCASSKSNTSSSTDPGREARQERRQDERQQLLADLNLSPAQKTKVEEILKSSQSKMESIRNAGGDRRLKFQQMRNLSEETNQKLSAVLDADQMRIYEAYREKQRAKMREQMAGGRGGRGRF